MYQGNYVNKRKPRRRYRSKKPSALLIALVAILGALVGTTIAYLFTNTGSITNTFTPGNVTTTITEDFDGKVKDYVKVENTGNVEAYIRATVVITWQDDKGNVYPTAPVKDTDYTVTWTNTNEWVEHGGYYYYTSAVAPNESTSVLLTACKPLDTAPEGYHLVVEVLASAIQSKPADAVQAAWPVTVNTDGTLNVGGNA